jgi:lariat debranching enzyme
MKIAVEGCGHGELDAIYASLKRIEQEKSTKVDLLLIGGDFQVPLTNPNPPLQCKPIRALPSVNIS